MLPLLGLALASSTAEGSDISAWVMIPLSIGLLLLFPLFGYAIWRMANPANWTGPCPSCRRQGGHSKTCPDRPPRRDDGSWGGRLAQGGIFALLQVFLGGGDD